MTSTAIRPFHVDVPQAELDDLRDRLARTRWPDDYEGVGWDYGTDLATMKELTTYWRDGYDWRRQEAYLNSFPHYTAGLDGEELTFIHVRGTGPDPIPLLLLHGWPDSVCRYLKLIPLLTDPASHGGDPGICFDVVVPWLIGRYRGGSRAPRSGLFRHIAEQLWTLMTRELGYQRFGAAGGDGGSVLAQLLGVHHPDSVLGAHLTDLGFTIAFAQFPDLSEAEQRYFAELQGWSLQEGAYAMVQGTKPQTLAFGLSDSPVGFAAWIIEKFCTWSDCDGRLENLYTKDELLTNVMLYWLNGPPPGRSATARSSPPPRWPPTSRSACRVRWPCRPRTWGRSCPGSWPSVTSPTCAATPCCHTAGTSRRWNIRTSWRRTCGPSSPTCRVADPAPRRATINRAAATRRRRPRANRAGGSEVGPQFLTWHGGSGFVLGSRFGIGGGGSGPMHSPGAVAWACGLMLPRGSWAGELDWAASPNDAAALRLVGAILADMRDEWQSGERHDLSEGPWPNANQPGDTGGIAANDSGE